ncbi:calcium-binding protein [Hansschlegelia zhihuaiae]|uniref:Calcium-binding protein n=1 Tax=Hansschlegelia zhihuaiae TaxID=405005 RepID=A0A4Q0M9V0_9HYPH|nr:calcium-binding protein [Hansschlegelia zhihuaiae]RXF69934.1 calcium-binding protein [Hansschlegelia zhihuaiae]
MSKVTYADLADAGDTNLGIYAPRFMFGSGLLRDGAFDAFRLTGSEGVELFFGGEGFTYNEKEQPLTGTATSCEIRVDGETLATITDFTASAKQLRGLNTFEEFFEIIGKFAADGSAGEDVILGFNGNDTLRGRESSDTLIGAAGNDKMFGGADDDAMYFGQGRDSLDGGDGQDIAAFASTIFGVGKIVDLELDLRKSGFQSIEGGGSVKFYTVEGIVAGGGDDKLTGDQFGNVLGGGEGSDTLLGGAGDDTISGGGGADVLQGGEGFDTLIMGSFSGKGVNVSLANPGSQNTGEGKDRISGFENLVGTFGDDKLTGDAQANRIEGEDGDDTITGGGGLDSLLGGGGADRFVFNAKSLGVDNKAEILDFEVSLGDLIDVSGIDANTLEDANQAFSFIGTGAFTSVAGQLRWSYLGGDPNADISIEGDTNGDGAADLFIQLRAPVGALAAEDFVL